MDRDIEILNEVHRIIGNLALNPDPYAIAAKTMRVFSLGREYERLDALTAPDAEPSPPPTDENRSRPEQLAEPGGVGLEQIKKGDTCPECKRGSVVELHGGPTWEFDAFGCTHCQFFKINEAENPSAG